uniref:Large ribosomal subunit protein uL24c n=1 Tax=Chorda asiatica TaxID=1281577 RepID=A0A8F0F9N2_9PHAE|nr:50S ribosomal protein L24 [Chorda asiatica]QWK43152.1 ribosomal protein L24 [Chorda asiatica]WAM62165.1 50S ribosomal protein L24 [Chorda asiatica]
MKKKMKLQIKVNIKLGEKVKIISGREKGKVGLVKEIIKKKNKLIVEGVNIKVKHLKPTRPEQNGEIKRIEFPIHSSNVSLYQEQE